MRREFTYWYPLDVRISGKELINNHLVFFLYTLQAIWGEEASRYFAKSNPTKRTCGLERGKDEQKHRQLPRFVECH